MRTIFCKVNLRLHAVKIGAGNVIKNMAFPVKMQKSLMLVMTISYLTSDFFVFVFIQLLKLRADSIIFYLQQPYF